MLTTSPDEKKASTIYRYKYCEMQNSVQNIQYLVDGWVALQEKRAKVLYS